MDDVLQLAYEKAFRKIATFRGDCSFRTWLHRVCWTTAVDMMRAEGRRRHMPIEEAERQPSTDPGPANGAVSRITWDDAWGRFSDDQRGALVLVIGDGLSYDEAAQVVGVRPGTVASRVSRARVWLWELLGEGEPPGLPPDGVTFVHGGPGGPGTRCADGPVRAGEQQRDRGETGRHDGVRGEPGQKGVRP